MQTKRAAGSRASCKDWNNTAAPPRGALCFRFPFFLIFMALTSEDIVRIAHLARIRLDDAQRQQMLEQLNGLFGIVETIRAVDTSGVQPLTHPIAVMRDVQLRLQDDDPSEPNQREANMANAPAAEGGLFLVPKVIE